MVNCQRVFCFNQMPEKCTWCHNIPVIDSIYCLITLFSLFGSLTFIIIYTRQWASEHGKAVRQLSVRQNNTKHAAGTLPLNMYRKELPVGDWVTEDPSSADDIGDQLSENDSDSSRRRRQCHPRRRHSRGCSCKLAIKDSPHAYRTTDHAFISCSFFILRYKKLFLFAEAFKNTRKFKISIERINLHLTFISFCRN